MKLLVLVMAAGVLLSIGSLHSQQPMLTLLQLFKLLSALFFDRFVNEVGERNNFLSVIVWELFVYWACFYIGSQEKGVKIMDVVCSYTKTFSFLKVFIVKAMVLLISPLSFQ